MLTNISDLSPLGQLIGIWRFPDTCPEIRPFERKIVTPHSTLVRLRPSDTTATVEILCGPPFLFTSTSHLAVVYLRIGTRFCSLYLHLQTRTGCAFGDVKRCSPAILVYALCDAYCFADVLNVRFEYHLNIPT